MDREVTHTQVIGLAICASLGTVALCVLAAGGFPEKGFWSQEAAGWASAFATLLAIWFALTASDREHARTVRLRDEELTRAQVAAADRATALAVVFDHELYDASVQLACTLDNFKPASIRARPRPALDELSRQVPSGGLVQLTRFAGELDAFGRDGAAKLLIALSGWQTLTTPIKLEEYEEEIDDDLAESVIMICRAFAVLLAQVNDARGVTMQWASAVQGKVPAIEKSDHWS